MPKSSGMDFEAWVAAIAFGLMILHYVPTHWFPALHTVISVFAGVAAVFSGMMSVTLAWRNNTAPVGVILPGCFAVWGFAVLIALSPFGRLIAG